MRRVEIPNAALLSEVTRLVAEGHKVTIPLRGTSMRPFLEGDRDKAVLAPAASLRVGDVVLAEIAPGKYVLHRIVRIAGEIVTLLGDGNIVPERCALGDIRAVASAFIRGRRQRQCSTTGLRWRAYSWLWMRLRPLRRYLLYIYRHLKGGQ